MRLSLNLSSRRTVRELASTPAFSQSSYFTDGGAENCERDGSAQQRAVSMLEFRCLRVPKSRIVRLVLGVGTALPLLGIALIAYALFGINDDWLTESARSWFWFKLTWGVGILGGTAGVLLTLYYLSLVFTSDASESERQFWVMSLMLFFPIAGLTFWYRVIWKLQTVSEATIRA
ncbi:MAG TPA: hypothetical protein VGQ76_13650 [Thermoanaerobaculia bacterium]|jgi:hypothetical protein|nr:hypothetical protein [Thermoanaerobaculia bacterium]